MKTRRFFLLALALTLANYACPVNAETFREALARGNAALDAGDEETAISAFVLAKSMSPGFNDGALQLARLYANLHRWQEAESEYQNMISQVSSKPATLRQLKGELAGVYANQGKFRNALTVYQEMLAETPNDPQLLFAMGHCLEGSDNLDSAKDYYNQVVTNNPNTMVARAAQSKLDRLTKHSTSVAKGAFFPIEPDFGEKGFGWWNLKKMPIHVYIDDGSHAKGYRQSFRSSITNALADWQKLSHGNISFVVDSQDLQGEAKFLQALGNDSILEMIQDNSLPKDPIKTGIHIHWTDRLPGALGVAWTSAYGEHVAHGDEGSQEITYAHLWLATNSQCDGTPMPPQLNTANSNLFDAQDRLIAEVSIHELGHTLGMTHSSNPGDVMCSGIFALNSRDSFEARTLSKGDYASLTQHYNNFQGTGMPADAKTATGGKPKPVQSITAYSNREALPKPVQIDDDDDDAPAPVGRPARAGTPSKGPAAHPGAITATYKDALFDIQTGQYQSGQFKLDQIIKANPKDATALYLRAVANVMQLKYEQARQDYNSVIKLSPGTDLSTKAQQGLAKLHH